MTEIEEELVETGQSDETLLYDYFKHLTSLCIVSLGGVLALVPNAKDLSRGMIIAVLIVLGGAALISFTGAGEIVRARYRREPLGKSVNLYRIAAPVLLSVGVGMFIYLFTRTLKA
jgi:hypothetical protein